jgi:hypothetical protein
MYYWEELEVVDQKLPILSRRRQPAGYQFYRLLYGCHCRCSISDATGCLIFGPEIAAEVEETEQAVS